VIKPSRTVIANIALPINRDRLYRLATGTGPCQQTG
jgi:hypothetical protein